MNDNMLSSEALRNMGHSLLQLADRQFELECKIVESSPGKLKRNLDTLASIERNGPRLAKIARREYHHRLRRKRFLANDLLGEPIWDMMLDLFYHHIEGKRVTITSACIASHCPQTTALRYVSILESRGIIEKSGSAADNRVTYLELTREWVVKMGLLLMELDTDALLEKTSSNDEQALIEVPRNTDSLKC